MLRVWGVGVARVGHMVTGRLVEMGTIRSRPVVVVPVVVVRSAIQERQQMAAQEEMDGTVAEEVRADQVLVWLDRRERL